MNSHKSRTKLIWVLRQGMLILLVFLLSAPNWVTAQELYSDPGQAGNAVSAGSRNAEPSIFRVEKISVDIGADLITIHARRPRTEEALQGPELEMPLISVLRDTLGDSDPRNDKLRYVWLHSHTSPSLRQRAAAFIPFFYSGGAKRKIGNKPPPPVIDLGASDKVFWNKFFWYLFQRLVLNELVVLPRASAMQYRTNNLDNNRSAVADSMAALALFQAIQGEKVLSDAELKDLQARLSLTGKTFGWKMQSENLHRVFEQDRKLIRDYRGHNWELLRQYSEAEGLYFDPLVMPDGFARHAIVWTTEDDVRANKGKAFNRRFLNIRNPWDDERLHNWKGYTQVRWFNAEGREVDSETPGAIAKTMIPLALYGLDHPKVPMILVDFRDARNPRFRELSRRILMDVTDNVLALSRFHSMPYFLGRFVYDFVTGRRGMDLNQASRFRSYSQLRLLLAIDESLDPEFKGMLSKRVDLASTNPMSNDAANGPEIAIKQYNNLLRFAGQPDGLAKTIAEDRREEMVPLEHSKFSRAFFSAASVLSLGFYTHREKESPELLAELDQRRQLDYHERFLREVAANSAGPEIDTDVAQLKESLNFIAAKGDDAEVKTTKALARIYALSSTDELRLLCLTGLYKVNSSSAKRELLAIYKSSKPSEKSRDVSARYLKRALEEGKRISTKDVSSISAISEFSAN